MVLSGVCQVLTNFRKGVGLFVLGNWGKTPLDGLSDKKLPIPRHFCEASEYHNFSDGFDHVLTLGYAFY